MHLKKQRAVGGSGPTTYTGSIWFRHVPARYVNHVLDIISVGLIVIPNNGLPTTSIKNNSGKVMLWELEVPSVGALVNSMGYKYK